MDTLRLAELNISELPQSKIHTVRLELDRLRKEGLLVDLEISGISMFIRAAVWSELGIGEDDIRRGRFTTGSKYLIPKTMIDRLRSVETRMRQTLDRHSYDLTGFRPYRWIPVNAYKAWHNKWFELLSEFDLVKAEIIDQYDSYRDSLAGEFAEGAHQAWHSLVANGYTGIQVDGFVHTSVNTFADALVEKALAKLPDRETVETRLPADYRVGLVYSDEDVAADDYRAQQIRAEASLEWAQADAKKQEAYLQSNILQSQLQHQKDMQTLEEEEKQVKINAMLNLEGEHIRQQLQSIASPLDEAVAAFAGRLAQDCTDMLTNIQGSGFVRGKIAEKGRGLLELYNLLAVKDNKELRSRLVDLQNAIGPIGAERSKTEPERNTAAVATALQQIIELAHVEAGRLSQGPSRSDFLEI